MKKIICSILAAVLAMSLAACGGAPSTGNNASGSTTNTPSTDNTSKTPEENDPILTGEKPELKILSMYQAYNYEEQPSYKLLEELTGYKTKWFMLPAENADQKLMLEISGGTSYDLLLRMSPNGYAQLSSQNALMEITPVLEKYGNNINTLISDFAWQAVTTSSGVRNGIPHEDMVASPQDTFGMFTGGIGVRSDKRAELGLELPKTIDEFTAFLKAAKTKFGGVPLTANKGSSFTSAIMTAFGMGDAEWYDVDGVYTHRIKTPQFADYLAYMQMLYKEKLLDNDMPINTGDNAKEKFASGSSVAIAPLMFWDIPSMVKAIATSNPDAKSEFITDLAKDANTKPIHWISRGAKFYTCIPQTAANPEHAINWLNTLSTEENYRRVYIGEEGVSYEIKDDSYHPIFNEANATNDFSAYTNSDKFSGIGDALVGFKMWQARARKTPEMAVAYEAMNARVDEYEGRYTIEAYGKTAPEVQQYATALGQELNDSFLKAIVEGTDSKTAVAAMQATWDKNGGLEMEKSMQAFYEANKQFAK